MKSKIILVALALMGAGAWAADPVAIWDGDNTDLGNFTLTADNGNTIGADHSIAIEDGATGGVVYTGDNSSLNNSTFIIRGSGLDLSNAGNQYLLTLHQNILGGGNGDASYNKVGASLAANNDTVRGIWGNAYYGNDNYQVAEPFATGNDIVINIQTSGGVFVYEIVTDSGTGDRTLVKRYGNTNLKASNTNYKGFSLGGIYEKSSSTLVTAEGWTISKMAVFGSTLSEAEMLNYLFPSEIQAINITSGTTVSDINAQIDSENYKGAAVSVADGVTIEVDAAFSAKILSVSSAGTITLAAGSQPDASYLSAVDFSGVKGGLLRSWLTPGVVGFNFRSANGSDVSGALVAGENWIHNNNSASGTSTALFADGLSTLTWSSANTWRYSGTSILCGYLDDGANGGNGAEVTLSYVPYETYDVVIYCSSDGSTDKFLAKTVNGTTYTWDSTTGTVVAGDSVWGQAALSVPVYGVNALRVKNLSGPLTIYGTARNGSNRGGIAAIQIMPPDTPDNIRTYTLTLNGTATTWSNGTWTLNNQTVDAPASGYVEIVASASTALTVDQAVNLADLKISGGDDIVVNVSTNSTGSLYAIKATVESGVFQQGSPAVLGTTPSIVVANGATFDLNGLAVSESNAFSIEGAGAGSWPWALTSSGGAFPTGTLRGFTLTGDATIGGANKIGCGKIGSASHLGFGTYKLTKVGAGELSFTNIRSATGSSGTFDIAGGSVTLNEYTNLDGSNADGDPWAKTEVIVRSGATFTSKISRWVWIGSLVLDGGEATTTSSYIAMQDGFSGSGTLDRVVFKADAAASLTGDLAVTSEMVLNGNMSFVKDPTASADVVMTPAALTASSGTITVGSGVTFNVGTSRPGATITVVEGGTLGVKLLSASDVITLSTSAQPANVILYDANGDVVSNPRVTYSDGTLTIMPPVPTLPASGTVAFDTATNWEDEAMPGNDGDAIIELADDATITVSGTYTLGSLTITGSGVVTFSGNGTITAANISVKNGATFTRNANISATTGISLDAGTVLRLDGVTENAAISGAGAVETYGTVVLAHANTMTGGITVKPGSALSTTAAGGYGEYQSGWAYTAQRQVVVEDGGTVDINNVANNDGAVALTIAGQGILSGDVYSGAVTYSGANAITSGSRQISSLVLTGDAMVDLGKGWGLVHSGWGNARLGLAGHTLTVRGTGTFPVVNANNLSGAATTGTLVMDGATLELSNAASNLAGVNVVAKGCATINVAAAPSALGSLTLKPSATGTTATNWNLPEGLVPALDTSNVDPAGLSVGDELTLFTAPSATVLTAETIAVTTGGRYTTTISGNTVTATVVDVLSNPFIHYDFNAVNAIAADSRYNVGNLNPALVNSNKGKAGTFVSSYKPYYDSNTSGRSPFHAGEMSVMSLIKIKETNNTILWNLGDGWGDGIALIAKDAKTVAMVSWTGGAAGSDVVAVAGESDITNAWHLVTIVADANGTTLYVDDESATVSTVLPNFDGKGQFGSIHGTAKNYTAVAGAGYLLDDWRIYDVALSATEIASFRADFLQTVDITVPKVDHTTVTVGTAEVDVLDLIDHGDTYTYTVITGATVKVSYTSDDYAVTGGEFEFAATDGYTVDTTGVTTTLYVASITTGETTTKYTSIQAAIDANIGGAATITVLPVASEYLDTQLTISNNTRVAIEDASGLFTGDITVEESGILDLSNRQAAACVACTNLTLKAGAGLWLPEGVTGSVKVAENLIADALVDVKIGDAYTQTFTVASSDTGVLTLRALRATAKPVAVWNADFGTGAITRGGFTLDLNNGDNTQDLTVTNDTTITIGAGAAGGVRFMREAASGYQLTAIARINTGGEVDVTATPVLFSLRNTRPNNDNIIGVGFGDDGYMYGLWAGEKTSSDATELGDKPVFSDDWLFVAGRFWSMAASDSTVTHGTYGYWDGNQAVHDLKVRNDSERVYGITLGGLYADNTKNLGGAQIDYVAIFDRADETLDDGVPAWSLANMTTVETLPATATALAGNTTTGFNLSGGTITISEPTTAAAVFVQEDTTLKFTGSGSLTIANNGLYFGPVYVAEGKTLTIDASESTIVAGKLIHGAIYGQVAIAANDPATKLAYIADDGLYRGGWPSDSKVLTIVVNGDAAITGGDFTGLKALTVAGAGTLTMTGCALEADEFTLDAGVSLTLDEVTYLSAPTTAIDGTLTTAGVVTNTTLTVTGAFNATNVIATTVEVAGSMAIAAGGTLEATTLTVAGDFTTAGTVTVPTINVTGTLTTAGEVTATTVNALGESFTVAAGGNLTVNGDRGLSGTVTVEQDGKLTSGRNDAMNYSGNCTVHLYGQLDFAATRWTLNANNRIYLYEGCKILGTGDSTADNAVMDLLGAAVLLNVTGNVTIDNNLRIRGNANIYVNDNSTLTLNGLLGYAEAGQLIKSGGGTMVINGQSTSPNGLNAYVGTIRLGSEASVAGTVRVQAQGALDVAALASPAIAGAVTLDQFATVAIPDDADLVEGVQLTTSEAEGALTVDSFATIVKGATTYTNASVQVLDNNKLAMVAQSEHVAAITGDTTWDNISWMPTLPADPAGRKLTFNVNSSAVIDGGALAKTTGAIVFNVAQDSMLTLTNLTLSADVITVNGGAVQVYGADALTGIVVGNGTVVYTGAMPASPADKFTNPTWRGTLWLERQHGLTGVTFANFGNANSTLRLTDMQLWCNGGDFAGTLDLSNADSNGDPADYALEINNGGSTYTTTFAKLTGSGTVRDTDNAATHTFAFTDVSGFTGSINIVGNKRIKIGSGSQTVGNGQIVVQPGVTATIAGDATWSAANGIQVYGTLNVEGKIDGSVQCHDSGKFVVTSGNAVLGDLRDFTYVTLDAGTEVDWVSVEQTKLEAIDGRTRVENIVDANIKYINFIKYNGDEVKVAKDADNVAELEEDPQVSGDVCWYDFTFTKEWYDGQADDDTTVKNIAGSASGVLQLDSGYMIKADPTAFNSTNGNLRIRATPYFNSGTITYPDNFSVAMYTMMPERANDVLMAFGTVAGGYLAVVRGDGPNEIKVVWGQNSTKQEIAAFSVVAAKQTQHLIMFTKEGQEIAVYLDGDATPLAKETLASGRTIANQFQVASIHGGEQTASTGLQRPAAAEKAELAMLRIYDYVLTGRMIARLAGDFPVEAWDNFALRALDAANGTNTWYDAVNRPWSYTTDGKAVISAEVENGIQPLDDAHIVISNVSELTQWVDVVLPDADSGAGNFTVAGTSPVIIHHSIGGHAVDVAGAISNEVDLTIYYGAINMANTRLYMTESATLKLELTEFLRDCEAAGDYTLTGICGNFGGRVSCSAESDNLFFSVDGGIKYDSDRQRYYVTVVAKRSDPQEVYLTVDGSNITVGTDTSVYYLDGTAQRYTRLVPGDTLYLAGTVGSVTLNKDYGLAGYDIPAGVTLVADNFQVKGTITGAGTLRCIGQHPKVDESPTTTIDSLKNAEGWTGTVEIENCNLGATRLDNFGNVSSTLRLIGCSVALSGDREETIGLDLADTVDGRTYDYGLWFKGVSGSDGAVAVYPALTGRGTLRCANSATTVTYLRIPDMGGFLGTIDQAIAATGGIKLVLGDTGTADLSGLVGDSSMYVSDGTVWQVYGDVAAATNLTVKGTLLATGIAPKVAAEQIVFDGGKVVIGEPAAYPMLQGTVTGAIEVDFADGLAGDSITALAHLGAEAAATTLTLTPVGNAAKYTVQREEGEQEDGTFTVYYKLIRNFFYIRIR